MKAEKIKKLEAKGWKVGSAADFLELGKEDAAYIELKLSLGENLKKLRSLRHLTQIGLARRLRSSQSRVAKMESGDPSVSIDLLVRSILALGKTRKDLAKMIAPAQSKAA